MVLVGNLKDLRLANIIQINCIEQNVAKVTVTSLDRSGYLYFANGQIVHAEFNPYIGERAVQEMLSLSDGQFKVEAGVKAPANTITRPWNSVVLEGLRLIDEKNQQLAPLPKQLFTYIAGQKGVKNVYVIDYNGRIIEGKISENVNPLTLTFIWYKLKKMVTLFYTDFFEYTVLRWQDGYLFIFEVRPNLIIIETDLFVIVPEFTNRVKKILKRIMTF
ncbi:hypothetical protein B1H10_01810 [candidate division KSB1 bacterium 4484_188]|nr:MAG: hypothetical protein B1H10_01810 [candidate division KSB1 bacterium 4484_188]